MKTILDLIRSSPNCKVTFRYSSSRKKPQAGDIKTSRGTTYIRQQQYSRHDRAWVVGPRRAPRWEWVVKDSENDQTSKNYRP